MTNKRIPTISGHNFIDILVELKMRGRTTSFLTDKDVQFFEDLLSIVGVKIKTNGNGGIEIKFQNREEKAIFGYYVSSVQKIFEANKFNFPNQEEFNSRRKMLLFSLSYFDIEFFEENTYSITFLKPLDKGIYT